MTLINDEFVKEDSKKMHSFSCKENTLQMHSFSCQKL